MNLFGMGPMEILVIMIVALIILGPGKLPEAGAQVGKAVRDFRRAPRDLTSDFEESISDVQTTMGEMRATVNDVKRETEEIVRTVPAAIESPTAPTRAAASMTPNGAGASTTVTETRVPEAPVEPAPASASVSKNDPLADFESLDDSIFAPPPKEEL